jgi:hypothetical protein
MPDATKNTVLLTEDDITAAKRLLQIVGADTIAKVMGLGNTNELRQLIEGVDCQQCGAPYFKPCITNSGGRARKPHKARLVILVAVIFALEKEIVIHEEDHIEDFL